MSQDTTSDGPVLRQLRTLLLAVVAIGMAGTAVDIPTGKRMAHEFEEYRSWKTLSTFIRVNLNTASDADILGIPGAGPPDCPEFKEYGPWKTKTPFEKEIGKYLGVKEVARLWRCVVIE